MHEKLIFEHSAPGRSADVPGTLTATAAPMAAFSPATSALAEVVVVPECVALTSRFPTRSSAPPLPRHARWMGG